MDINCFFRQYTYSRSVLRILASCHFFRRYTKQIKDYYGYNFEVDTLTEFGENIL